MLEEVRAFSYDIESTNAQNNDRKVLSPHQSESEYSEPIENSATPMLTVLDIQKVPYNKEEEIK